MNLTIIVISFNTCDMTCDCLRSIYRETRNTNFEVIVVDNASSDGSADAIASEFPQASLIRSEDNLGFAKANNLAAEHGRGSRLLLLNPDTIVLDHAVDRLNEFADTHSSARIWGGRTVFADGTLNPTSSWRFMTIWSLLTQTIGLTKLFPDSKLFNREGYGGWKRDTRARS